uniref:Peptidoglycan-recognition protein n=1 Tax=Trichogramma kaykai TaxID=54128 RepID=A0ABD2WI44_9HYME
MSHHRTNIYFSLLIHLSLLSLSRTQSSDGDPCPNVVERSRWGARPWRNVNYLVTPLLHVVVHHTQTPDCDRSDECADLVKSIQNYHMNDLKLDDIGYSFLIGGDGNVYEGAGWYNEGKHTRGYDRKSVSLAFIGNFQKAFRNSTMGITIDKNPSEKSLKAAHDLVACGKRQGFLRQNVKVYGARQIINTDSPGNKLFARIKNWPEWSEIHS